MPNQPDGPDDWKDYDNIHGELARNLPDDFGRQTKSAPRKPITHLKLNLLENGIDFIRSGINSHLLTDQGATEAHKYALLHLFAGVVLILKERLRREHSSLIFLKVEDVGSDDRPTVTVETLLQRLGACAGVSLDADDERLIRSVARLRNRIEHYAFEINLKETQFLAGRLCEFVFVFLKQHLETNLQQHLDYDTWDEVQGLRGIAERLEQERRDDWKRRHAKYRRMSTKKRQELFESTEYHPRDNPIPRPVYWCPTCQRETVVGVAEDMGVCTNGDCKAVHEASLCARCGSLVPGQTDVWVCEQCAGYMDRD